MNKQSYKILLFLIPALIFFHSCTVFYSDSDSAEAVKDNYPNYNYEKGEFVNSNPIEGVTGSFLKIGYKFMFENNNMRKPNFEIPTEKINMDSFANRESEQLSLIWLGHATTLINIDGTIILTDPMLTKWNSTLYGKSN